MIRWVDIGKNMEGAGRGLPVVLRISRSRPKPLSRSYPPLPLRFPPPQRPSIQHSFRSTYVRGKEKKLTSMTSSTASLIISSFMSIIELSFSNSMRMRCIAGIFICLDIIDIAFRSALYEIRPRRFRVDTPDRSTHLRCAFHTLRHRLVGAHRL